MNIYELRAEILKKLIGDSKPSEFCKKHNLNPSFISQILNNKRNIGDAAALTLESDLGLAPGTISAPQLKVAEGFEPAPEITRWKRVNIKGIAQLGENGFWSELEDGDGTVEVISADPHAYALRVRGDSMTPAIRNGWVVWCEPSKELVSGEYVMVKTKDGQCMVKELLYHNNSETSLMSVNADYERLNLPTDSIEQIHYVGGIVPPSKIKL